MNGLDRVCQPWQKKFAWRRRTMVGGQVIRFKWYYVRQVRVYFNRESAPWINYDIVEDAVTVLDMLKYPIPRRV